MKELSVVLHPTDDEFERHQTQQKDDEFQRQIEDLDDFMFNQNDIQESKANNEEDDKVRKQLEKTIKEFEDTL